jgi:hypothetical protein
MTFNEIIEKLTYGKKVRRSVWPESFYMDSDGDTIWEKYDDKESKKIVTTRYHAFSDRTFSLEDVLADDWELYK